MGFHLRAITFRPFTGAQGFPFNLPLVESLGEVHFISPVTFFEGENGTGKSTLLEAIACAIGAITVGSESVRTDQILAPARRLVQAFKLSWTKRTQRGFFLRAEDFFGYARQISQVKAEMEQNLRQFIIATHSLIILAFPRATILSFDQFPIQPVPYGVLEHVSLTKAFLDNPEAYLLHL